MRSPEKFQEEMARTAVLCQPFALYLMALLLWKQPAPVQWSHADPLLRILPGSWGLWLFALLTPLCWGFWVWRCQSSWVPGKREVLWAGLGALVAFVLLSGLRLSLGPHFPSFIPPEESSLPGYALSMAAGLGEEALFRLLALPFFYSVLARRLSPRLAAGLAIVAAAFFFAFSHELAPGMEPVLMEHRATRFLIPGCLMGLGCFLFHPALVVVGHSTAHLLIPLYFG